jgi:hypothetical protein
MESWGMASQINSTLWTQPGDKRQTRVQFLGHPSPQPQHAAAPQLLCLEIGQASGAYRIAMPSLKSDYISLGLGTHPKTTRRMSYSTVLRGVGLYINRVFGSLCVNSQQHLHHLLVAFK